MIMIIGAKLVTKIEFYYYIFQAVGLSFFEGMNESDV
uniref:Uncharacterized protein n=1 Tax=Anguilla anguilla TaxID=7936 RepID=A0A0E9Q2Q1_ANGAN